jgi:hypothetical protein
LSGCGARMPAARADRSSRGRVGAWSFARWSDDGGWSGGSRPTRWSPRWWTGCLSMPCARRAPGSPRAGRSSCCPPTTSASGSGPRPPRRRRSATCPPGSTGCAPRRCSSSSSPPRRPTWGGTRNRTRAGRMPRSPAGRCRTGTWTPACRRCSCCRPPSTRAWERASSASAPLSGRPSPPSSASRPSGSPRASSPSGTPPKVVRRARPRGARARRWTTSCTAARGYLDAGRQPDHRLVQPGVDEVAVAEHERP